MANTLQGNFDRGHMIPINHFDSSVEDMRLTNKMSNIHPQVAQMNRGAQGYESYIIFCVPIFFLFYFLILFPLAYGTNMIQWKGNGGDSPYAI